MRVQGIKGRRCQQRLVILYRLLPRTVCAHGVKRPGGGAVKQLCAQQGVRLPQPLQPGLGFNAAVGAQLLGTLQSLSYGHLITSFL